MDKQRLHRRAQLPRVWRRLEFWYACVFSVYTGSKTSGVGIKQITGSEDLGSGDEQEISFREPKGGKGGISKGDNIKGGGGGGGGGGRLGGWWQV